jgi:protein-S-isoprenylcysteine O-methyltransferase Ste14
MQLERILAWLPLVTLLAIVCAGRLWALVMRGRGVRAIIVGWQRPIGQLLYDSLMIVVAMFWIYLLVAGAWPLSLDWLPGWLMANVVDSRAVILVGAALVVAAPVLYVAALRSMGMSWRIGIDTDRPGPLVTAGLFAWTRNPIYTAMDLLISGSFLIHGRAVYLFVGAILMLMVDGIILREERFLAARFGEDFHAYCGRVGRYSPRIWRRAE